MPDYRPEGRIIYNKSTGNSVFSEAALHEAMTRGAILEARALLCDNDHNLHVNLVETVDLNFAHTDHQPVYLEVVLK